MNKSIKTLTGQVVSNKMDKTIVVKISRKIKHPLYEKYIRQSTKVMVHDHDNQCNEGDVVMIETSRPLSKNKSWKLREIVSQATEI